jgi:hypothetical protein
MFFSRASLVRAIFVVLLSFTICSAIAAQQAPSNPATATSSTPLQAGHVTGNVYTNDFFGFTYTFPRGWKLLTPENSGQKDHDNADDGALIVGTPGDPPDITALAISFHQLPKATAVTERQYLTDQRSQPPQNQLKPSDDVVEYSWGAQRFLRQAYSGKVGGRQMWQIDSVMFTKGYVLQVRFMTNTKKRVDEFLSTGRALSFSAPK